MAHGDTIVAVATAPGHGGVGIVRVSGPAAMQIAGVVLGHVPAPRQAVFASFSDAAGAAIDKGVAICFQAPASYTGEDTLELQAHGNPLVLSKLVRRCVELGARAARAGEFTERAFLNGKLSLDQAEAVADLVAADSEAALEAARRSLQGEFADQIETLADELTALRALIEASLDFPEEGDIDWLQRLDVRPRLAAVMARVVAVLSAAQRGLRLRDGYCVAIVGAPNVGKSTLLNALAGEDLAIVSDVAGTTRDTLRSRLLIDGVPIELIDTAGLRNATDPIEREGIERARQAAARCDLLLCLVDERDASRVDLAQLDVAVPARPRLVVRNKADLPGGPDGELRIVARSGTGLSDLRAGLLERLGWQSGVPLVATRARHLQALQAAAAHLSSADGLWAAPELLAEELRQAADRLGEITGRVVADDLLGRIFADFCIGK